MDYKVKRTGSYEVEIFLNFKSDDVENAYQNAYQNARGQMKMDGFRNGKIPMEIVEKTLGDSVLSDVSNHLLRDAMSKILDNLDPVPINMPDFSVENIDRKKGAKIKGTYHARPIFKLAKYKKLKVIREQVVVTDENVEEEIKKAQKQNAIMHTRSEDEKVQMNDTIIASVKITKDDGTEIFNNEKSNLEMTNDTLLPGMSEKIIGMKISELNEFDLLMPEDYNDENLAGCNVRVAVVVKEIKYSELPELNDDFARDMGDFENYDEYVKSVRSKLLENGKHQIDEKLKNELLTLVAKASNIEVPPTMIETEASYRLDHMAQQMGIQFPGGKKASGAKSSRKRKKSQKQESESKLSLSDKIDHIISIVGMEKAAFEKDLNQVAQESVKEQLVLSEIVEKEKIAVSKKDIMEKAKDIFGHHFKDEDMGTMLENQKLLSSIESQLLTEKAFNVLISLADVKKGDEIPVDQIGKAKE